MKTLEEVYQFRALFQGMTEALIVQDENENVIRFNEAATKLLRVSPAEILNLKFYSETFRAIKEDLTPLSRELMPTQLARKSGTPQLNNVIGIYLKDELRWLNVNAVPIFYENAKSPRQILVTFKDITEEKLGRERLIHLQYELAQREKFLNTILNALPVLVSYLNKEGKYQYVNSTYERWFKVGKQDVLGKPIDEIVGKEAFAIIKPYVENVLKGESQTFTSKIPYQGAGERTVEVYYVPDIAPEGVRGFFAIINDITALVTISLKIEKQEKELRLILDALPALIGHWDKNLMNIQANVAYSAYFGKTPDEIQGKHIKELLGEELFQKNLPYMTKVLAGEVQTFERDIPLPGGGVKHTLATYLPDITDGQIEGFFVIVTDISSIKELLKKELESREKAERATKLRDDMVAVVSHDLRNPLSIIMTSSEMLLKDKELQEKARKNVERIRKTSKVMITMLTDLLDINKIEQGHFEVHEGTESQDITEFIQEIVELQRPLAGDKNILLFLEIEPDLPFIFFDADQLQRVFQNLIGNAIKFTPAGGSIWVKAKKSENGILFQIEDNGPGIDSDLLPIIFDRYSQGKKFATKGSGLGLAIAKGIIESHNGKIWVESKLGKGSTFNFELPYSGASRPLDSTIQNPRSAGT